jgi:DnaA family protein
VTHPQLPLPLRAPPEQRFDTFIGSESTCAALLALATGNGRDALLISGPPASGKTHLLMACSAAAESAGRRVAYLPLGVFAGHLGAVIDGLDQVDALCVDELEAIGGCREDEVALFDLHNRARSSGVAVIYAAREIPANLPLSLPDLRSRLAQCIQLFLPPLDEAQRRQLLQSRAAARGLELDSTALDYLFSRVGRDLVGLLALLERIDRASLAAQRRITVPFLRTLLQDQPAT